MPPHDLGGPSGGNIPSSGAPHEPKHPIYNIVPTDPDHWPQAKDGNPNPLAPELDPNVITLVCDQLLSNYKSWCTYVGKKTSIIDDSALVGHKRTPPPTGSTDLIYCSLFLLIWGEAANVRFLPECLCYIFHHLATETNELMTQSARALSRDRSIPSQPYGFLNTIIQPLYNAIKGEADSNVGGKLPHAKWRNYDDFNEFFWSPRCFDRLSWPPNQSAVFFIPPNKTGHEGGKTGFVEQRTILNMFRSFDRVWILLIFAFQLMFITALKAEGSNPFTYLAGDRDTVALLLTCFITWAGINLFLALADMVMEWRLIRPSNMRFNVRLLLRLLVAIAWCIAFTALYIVMWNARKAATYWSPAANTAMIYIMDLSIFYAIFSSVVGYIMGVFAHIGEYKYITLPPSSSHSTSSTTPTTLSSPLNHITSPNQVVKATTIAGRWKNSSSSLWRRLCSSDFCRCAVLETFALFRLLLSHLLIAGTPEHRMVQQLLAEIDGAASGAAGEAHTDRDFVDDFNLGKLPAVQAKLVALTAFLLRGPTEEELPKSLATIHDAAPCPSPLHSQSRAPTPTPRPPLPPHQATMLERQRQHAAALCTSPVTSQPTSPTLPPPLPRPPLPPRQAIMLVQNLHEVAVRDFWSAGNYTLLLSKGVIPRSTPPASPLYVGAIRMPDPSDPTYFAPLQRLHSLLTCHNAMATIPANPEARRRVTFFCNSLFMAMPPAPTVQRMRSFCVMTPYYNESVMYSPDELRRPNEDGISLLYYLQNIFPGMLCVCFGVDVKCAHHNVQCMRSFCVMTPYYNEYVEWRLKTHTHHSVQRMRSFCVMTPYYNESVMYSPDELRRPNEDGISLLYYLQTSSQVCLLSHFSHALLLPVPADEWKNLEERLGVRGREVWEFDDGAEVCRWASYRGQTLARTVRGIMYYHRCVCPMRHSHSHHWCSPKATITMSCSAGPPTEGRPSLAPCAASCITTGVCAP
ncbi:unnamed protein product [Closterium sp. NIES-54]